MTTIGLMTAGGSSCTARRSPSRPHPGRSRLRAMVRVAVRGTTGSVSVFVRDVYRGLIDVSHNLLALLGLVIAVALAFAFQARDLRHDVETWTLGWLQAREEARADPAPRRASLEPVPTAAAVPQAEPDAAEVLADALKEPSASVRATASELTSLNRQQASVAQWLARRYHVAPEPVSRLVQEAWSVGQKAGLDPTLILAIMAVESSFNPFAQSAVGAQGLMQVMTKIHNHKYAAFGGNRAAFDPVTNLRVGVQVLKECISRAGSIDGGLRSYVGAGAQNEDGGYAEKVLSEQSSLKQVENGRSVSPQRVVAVAAQPKAEAAVEIREAVARRAAPATAALLEETASLP